MKTLKSTTLNSSFIMTLALTILLICGLSQAAEPVTVTANKAVPVQNEANNNAIVRTNHESVISSEDGIPRAREDVIPIRTAVSGRGGISASELSELKISNRATDSKMQGFLARTSLSQLATVYREASQMIDQRHVSPPSYEARTTASIEDVISALSNEHFLRANSATVSPQTIQSLQYQLRQLAQNRPARDMHQAVALMQSAAEMVNRATGIRREAVALEFLNGTLDSLDKYSAFLPETAGARPGAMIDGVKTAGLEENLVGLGVELQGHEKGVELVGVIENSPAEELGLQAGDLIVAINRKSVEGQTLNQIADQLSGPAGSTVTLDILRDGKKYRGTAARRKFYVSSVTGAKIIDTASGTGYIRLKQFSESSAEDLEKAMWKLHNQGMKNLVFDLRGNPGGLLDECVDISNMFLPRGTIVSTRGRNASDNTQESATMPKTWSVPLVVLVDDNSASASEIFAAAIQENQRGVIVGRTSYGKGTVQTHFPMRAVPAILKLTTAKFYSPNGREMAGSGVTPDISVAVEKSTYRASNNDSDVQMAEQVFAQGTPSRMVAVLAGKQVNTASPLSSSQPAHQLQNSVREH